MSPNFISRLLGAFIIGILGLQAAPLLASRIDLDLDTVTLLGGLVGGLIGLLITPYLTIHPINAAQTRIAESNIQQVLMGLLGCGIGLLFGLLIAYPLSLLARPLNIWLPTVVSIIAAYLVGAVFFQQAGAIRDAIGNDIGMGMLSGKNGRMGNFSSRQLLLDTSVLIDGRILEIAETGFVGGTFLIPRFVLAELQRVADSSDTLRRNRGRRGLNVVNSLQQLSASPIRIIEDDIEEISDVDAKLVSLALRLDASIMTNDYNLNQVAEAQGVQVLNVNKLANAVRTIYIPGEAFEIKIIQEGKDENQGVGYLEDGTMVVVEKGKNHMNEKIMVTVTKLINRDTGRMIFAVPEGEANDILTV